jgi:hypothetical protein
MKRFNKFLKGEIDIHGKSTKMDGIIDQKT